MMRTNRSKWTFLFLFTALIPGHLFNWAVEWAFATTTTLLGVLYFRRFSRLYPRCAQFGLMTMLSITCISLIGYIFTLALSNFPTGFRDAVELLKPAMVFFSCTLALVFGPPLLHDLRRACFSVLTYGLICGLILMFEVPVLASLVDFVYGDTKTGFSDFFVRLSIPFENPNFFGLLAVLSLAIALNFSPRPDLKLVVVSLCAAGLSGSRTAWLTSALVLITFSGTVLAAMVTNRRNLSASKIVVAIVLPLAAAYYLPTLAESLQRAGDLIEILTSFDLGSDASYAERQALRNEATRYLFERPVFGWGAVKYSNLDVVDNQYFSLFLRFGIFGSLIILSVTAFGVFANLRPLAGTKDFKSGLLIWLVLAAWLWTGTFLENIRLAIIITLIFASASKVHEKPVY